MESSSESDAFNNYLSQRRGKEQLLNQYLQKHISNTSPIDGEAEQDAITTQVQQMVEDLKETQETIHTLDDKQFDVVQYQDHLTNELQQAENNVDKQADVPPAVEVVDAQSSGLPNVDGDVQHNPQQQRASVEQQQPEATIMIDDIEQKFQDHSFAVQKNLEETLAFSQQLEESQRQVLKLNSRSPSQQGRPLSKGKIAQLKINEQAYHRDQIKLAEKRREEQDTIVRIRFETQRRKEFVQQFDVFANKKQNTKLFRQEPLFMDVSNNQTILAQLVQVYREIPNFTPPSHFTQNIQVLCIAKCGLATFDFHGLYNIKIADLQFNLLKEIKNIPASLLELDVTSNLLENISFPPNSRIQVIKASRNRLTQLPSNIGELELLQVADFETNELKQIDLAVFQNNQFLKELNIGRNKFSNPLSQQFFTPSLEYLYMEMVSQDYQQVKCYLPNLKFLYLRDPPERLSMLKNLNINFPRLQYINFRKNVPEQSQMERSVLKTAFPYLRTVSQLDITSIQTEQLDTNGMTDSEQTAFKLMLMYTQQTTLNVRHLEDPHALALKDCQQLPGRLFVYKPTNEADEHTVLQPLLQDLDIIVSGNYPNTPADASKLTLLAKASRLNVRSVQLECVLSGEAYTQIDYVKEAQRLVKLVARQLSLRRGTLTFRKYVSQSLDEIKNIKSFVQICKRYTQIKQQCKARIYAFELERKQREQEEKERKKRLQEEATRRRQENKALAVRLKNQLKQLKDAKAANDKTRDKLYQYISDRDARYEAGRRIFNALKQHQFARNIEARLDEARQSIAKRRSAIDKINEQFTLPEPDLEIDLDYLDQNASFNSDEEADLRSQMSEILKQAESPRTSVLPSDESAPSACKFIKSPALAQHSTLNQSGCDNLSDGAVQQVSPLKSQQPEEPKASQDNTTIEKPHHHVLTEKERIALDKAKEDGWNIQGSSAAMAYYKMQERQKKLSKKQPSATERYELLKKKMSKIVK